MKALSSPPASHYPLSKIWCNSIIALSISSHYLSSTCQLICIRLLISFSLYSLISSGGSLSVDLILHTSLCTLWSLIWLLKSLKKVYKHVLCLKNSDSDKPDSSLAYFYRKSSAILTSKELFNPSSLFCLISSTTAPIAL